MPSKYTKGYTLPDWISAAVLFSYYNSLSAGGFWAVADVIYRPELCKYKYVLRWVYL